MRAGHVVPRGTRLVAGLRPGLSTRATYSTAQDVTLWPIEIAGVAYHQDRSALAAAGIGARRRRGRQRGAQGDAASPGAGRSASSRSTGSTCTSATGRRRRRSSTRCSARPSPPRPARPAAASGWSRSSARRSSALRDDEALMPRTRPGFEGYRLLREYFVMPERFHFARVDGLQPVVARCAEEIELVFLLRRPAPELADVRPQDLQLFATPIDQPLRARLQRRRDRPAPAAAGRARRPHPAARLRDLPHHRASRTPTATARRPAIPGLFGFGPSRGATAPSGGPSAGRGGRARTSAGRAGCAPPTPATTSS